LSRFGLPCPVRFGQEWRFKGAVLDQLQVLSERDASGLARMENDSARRLAWPSAVLVIIAASALSWAAVAYAASFLGML